jgi:DNA-binding transcriptional ArsR family regulator
LPINKLERIKGDTHNLNRIASLSNAPVIIQELKKLIGRSEIKAAILHLTKDEINAGDLSGALRIDSGNLSRNIEPFLANKGYISLIRKGRERYYHRSELVDLVGFESIPEFSSLIESWQKKLNVPQNVEGEPTNTI